MDEKRLSNPEAEKLEISLPDEEIEIVELDERLDLATDPYSLFLNDCCGNKGCICPS
jgi:hypothetical protein